MNRNYNTDVPESLSNYAAIGGGKPYIAQEFKQTAFNQGAGWPTGPRLTRKDANWVVLDASQLVTALNSASQDDVIWVPGNETIDMSNHASVTVDTRVSIASNRGNSNGGLIKAPSHPKPLFDIRASGTRFNGLRIHGGQFEYIDWPGYDAGKHGTGVRINADNVEVSNCEIRGWGHAAVSVGRQGFVSKSHIHHCDLVDNPMDGLGYGITVFRGNPLIQYNYFNNNRHSVAGDGYKECSYVARYNFVGPVGYGHAFDMHDAESNNSNKGSHGGKRVSIHHNIFKYTNRRDGGADEAVKIRGVPLDGGQVMNNWFDHGYSRQSNPGNDGDAILVEQTDSFSDAGIKVGNNGIDSNYYGAQSPIETVGIPLSIVN